jgi:hypothetical protein
LTLPYVVEDASRANSFTDDMEIAVLLCLAEAHRKRGGLLGLSTEKLSFVSKLHYPLWAIPWGNECVIVDGLEISSYTMVSTKPPDMEFLTEQIKRSTVVRESYLSTLKGYAKTLKDLTVESHISVEGVISDNGILSYLEQELPKSETETSPATSLSPTLNKELAEIAAENLVQSWMQIQSEIKGFQYAINVLNGEAETHEEKILQEIDQIQEAYETELSHIRPEVNQKIEKFISERETKMKWISRTKERELHRKLYDKKKLVNQLKKLELRSVEYKKRKEIRNKKGDKVGVARWSYKIKGCEKEVSLTKRKLQIISKTLDRTNREYEVALKKLNDTYQDMIEREKRAVIELESQANSETKAKKDEMNELQAETLAIVTLIKQLKERKQQQASNLKAVTISWKPDETTLVYVPFYLVGYKSKRKLRYRTYPPAVAMDHSGILTKMQRAFRKYSLESRMNLLLHSPSKALDKMLSSAFIRKMKNDKKLSVKLQTMGRSNNLLYLPESKEKLRRGLEKVRKEGWIKPEEKSKILNSYTK